MLPEISDTTFETTEFLLAAYLRAKGVLYLSTKRLTEQQATFIFKYPPEDILIAWRTFSEMVSARALYDSLNFFRDELRRTQ